MRTRLKSTIITTAVLGTLCIPKNTASALSYQDSVDVTFTLNPTVTISLSSSDLTISDLAPGSSSDSNIITVTTSSNATAGYSVYGTVGNSTYNTTNLKHTSSTDTNVGIFAPLTTTGTIGEGEWGVNYTGYVDASSSSTPTWGDGDWKGYANLPLYSSTTTGTKLIESKNAGAMAVGVKIGAKAKDAQIAGGYNNVINFVVTANPIPDTTNIQDLTLAQCQVNVGTNGNPANVGDEITVVDSRDSKEYTVRYINGACWMTQNLRYLGDTGSTSGSMIMKSATSNISADKTVTYYELKGTEGSSTSGKCYGAYSSSTYKGAGWTNACTHTADVTDVSDAGSSACGGSTCTTDQLGVWYNYAAATAGTITGASDNTTVDTYNICPKGWTLPNYDTSSPAGSINSVTSYVDVFSPVKGGKYRQGSPSEKEYGVWWSATVNTRNVYNRWVLHHSGSSLGLSDQVHYRSDGKYVRCVRTS